MYEYRCKIKRIVDGDTVDVDIDLGFEVWIMNQRIRLVGMQTYRRLVGIDAPETRTRDLEEKEQGLASKAFVERLLPLGSNAILVSKDYNGDKGKYGRIIGDFKVYDRVWEAERMLTQIMIREGFADRYNV